MNIDEKLLADIDEYRFEQRSRSVAIEELVRTGLEAERQRKKAK